MYNDLYDCRISALIYYIFYTEIDCIPKIYKIYGYKTYVILTTQLSPVSRYL